MLRISIGICLAALIAGCESNGHVASSASSAGEASAPRAAKPSAKVAVSSKRGAVTADQFDLQGTATLVREDRVKDGKALEARINRNPRNRVDVDGDGARDRLQVVEVRDGKRRRLDVRAIPSSKRGARPDDVAVPVATVDFEPADDRARVTVEYDPTVIVEEPIVIAFDAPIVVGSFSHWVLVVERPVFVGVAYVVIHEHHKHKHKHKKHKKF